MPTGIGKTTILAADLRSPAPAAAPVWKDRRLLMIGGIILAMALAEGAANDWLPLLMVDGHDLGAALGSAVYTGFATAMTIGRFSGGILIDRIGGAATMRVNAASAALGLALVIFVDSSAIAAAAVLFWGLGASLGFPVALSAAGDSGPNATTHVNLVATVGYDTFVVGPPCLGFLGDHYGLRTAMIIVLAFALAAIFLARAAGSPPTQTPTPPAAASGIPRPHSIRQPSLHATPQPHPCRPPAAADGCPETNEGSDA